MSHSPSAGPPADLLRHQIAGRVLNTAGVAFIAAAVAIALCVSFSVLTRTTAGFAVAVLMIASGDIIARRGGSCGFWCGTTTAATGYLLAAFFAHASYYVEAVSGFSSAFPCWILELTVAAFATIHASRHRVLRFAAVPFTLVATADVLFHALTSTDTVSLLGFVVNVSAVASVFGSIWFAGLTALHQQFEARHSKSSPDLREKASWLLYRMTHEVYFVLAAVNALALPKFVGSIEYAPLWWAIETPILLAICWRSKSFIKHTIVMGIWALSAVLLLSTKVDLSPFVRMAVPISGLAIALTYRFIPSTWALWQKRLGYSVYLYGAVGVAAALPLFQMTPLEALPYWLAQSAVVIVLALALRDKILQIAGTIAAVGSLGLHGSQWQHWEWLTSIEVIVGCYAMSQVYGRIKKWGGLPKSDFVPISGKQTLSAEQARWLEAGSAAIGYVTLLSASYLLINQPWNTVAWGIEGFALIAFGFLTDKVWHRASGLLAMALTSAKLTIFDLSGHNSLERTLVTFGAIGFLCIASGIFYLVESGRIQKKRDKEKREAEEKAARESEQGGNAQPSANSDDQPPKQGE